MPEINPDKSFVQLPLRLNVSAEVHTPDDWLTQMGVMMADTILKLAEHEKIEFLRNLNRHAGVHSTYSLKTQLHDSMKMIYAALTHPATPADQKTAIALKMVEGAANCTPGFHDRCNEIVISLSIPKNLDELLSVQRQAIISRAANQTTDEVHAYNRFFVMARNMGYGVRPLNPDDRYTGRESDEKISAKVTQVFTEEYTFFNVLNALQEQLADMVKDKGYQGRRDAGYVYDDFQKFDNTFLEPFVSMTTEELFITDEDENFVPTVIDINWVQVKLALLHTIRHEEYFKFSAQEEALLALCMSDSTSFADQTRAALSLIPTLDELARALTFFNIWPAEKKAGLVLYYLNDKSAEEQKAVLEKLEKSSGLGAELQSAPAWQKIYLTLAVTAGNLDKVRELVGRGADVNPVLGLLISKHKAAVINDPILHAAINQDGMNSLITSGANQGKRVADVWVSSKKGRHWLLEDQRLQALCPKEAAGKSLTDWLGQAQQERNLPNAGLFTPVHPKVKAFLQHIVYGEQDEAEKILIDHPQMQSELLNKKLKVKDYSGRKIMGTALQLALGAEDVRYHEAEICMVEMLQKYLKALPDGEAIMAAQIVEQFPEGYEELEKSRIAADEAALRKVVDAIGASANDAACEAALQTFYDYMKPKGVIKTGKHFNTQLLEAAFALYEQKYDEFGGFDSRKNNMFWRKVIGHIQRYLPACYAQAFCQSLYDIVDGKKMLSRSLEFQYDKGVKFFPLDLNPANRLGVDYALWGGRGGGRACGLLLAGAGPMRGCGFSKLCQTKKQEHWDDLCRLARNNPANAW